MHATWSGASLISDGYIKAVVASIYPFYAWCFVENICFLGVFSINDTLSRCYTHEFSKSWVFLSVWLRSIETIVYCGLVLSVMSGLWA